MDTDVLGIIAPHPPIMVREVGGPDADVTAASVEALTAIAALLDRYRPETLIVMSPHAPTLFDEFLADDSEWLEGSLAGYGAPEVRVNARGDVDLARAIVAEADSAGLPVRLRAGDRRLKAGELDQGAVVPLRFLDPDSRAAVVELSITTLSLVRHREFGRAIRRAAARVGRRVAFVASGDCSHRLTRGAPAGWSPRGAEFDRAVVEAVGADHYDALEHLDPELIEAAGECGLRSFVTLGGFLEGTGAETRVLAYEGPWGVGYLTAVAALPARLEQLDAEAVAPVSPAGTTAEGQADNFTDPVTLARKTIETFVREGRMLHPGRVSGLLAERHGAFVSLHRRGELRGCIGTIRPTTTSLAEEIVRNAIEAATADPRFAPVAPDELADLEISVDVLHEPEPAMVDELDPRSWGVIVSAGHRRGLLLPDLEGVDTVEQQVAIARRKAGIPAWEPVTIERFAVDRYR